MAIRALPFGASEGFSDQPVLGAHYYSQGFIPTYFGAATMYSIVNKRDSGTVTGMGNIKNFALYKGTMYAQDDNGNILKEQTPGLFDFAIVHSPSGTGQGLMADQDGNLFYANGASNNALGKYDGTTWTDNYEGFSYSGQHPMDWYEDLRLFADGNNVAILDDSNVWNGSAFSLPSIMNITAVKAGPTGILIGANLGYQGAIILWDGTSLRSKTPWKWTKGQILAIEKYDENWIVKTQRGTFITNGYTIKPIFTVFDDPLSFKSYDNTNVLPQQMTIINDFLVFAITFNSVTSLTYQYGKMKPGIYLYSLSRRTWAYIPVGTLNTLSIDINSLFADVNFNNRILIGYRDRTLGMNYIAQLVAAPPTRAVFVSEEIGLGHLKYTKGLLGPTDKIAENVILNLGILDSITDPATITLNVALKIYNYKRQLWGYSIRDAALGSSHKNQLQVNGSSASNYKAQVGDEITVLEGANAGQVAHIASIANQGASNETWTLDTTLPNATENNIHLQVQPFIFVEKKTLTSLTQFKNIFFNIDKSIRGKQFLAKIVFENIGTNLQLQIQTSYFVFDDIGYDQT